MRWLISVLMTLGCLPPIGAPQPVSHSLAQSWDELAGANGEIAYRALWRFASDPNTVAYFRDHLKPAAAPDPPRLRQMVADLANDDFTVRDAATKALEKLDSLAAAALTEALKPSIPLEAKRRIEALLDRLDWPVQLPQERLVARAVEALEMIGSADARRLLREYAKGAPGARLTRLAGEAERRLEKRLRLPSAAPPAAKNDGDGNPLPFGAIARLGTTRFRIGSRGQVFFTPDGRGVADWPFGPSTTPLRVFDVVTGKVLYEVAGPLGGDPHAFAFAPDGKTLAYAFEEDKDKISELRLIDWPSGKQRQTHDLGPGSTVAMTFRGGNELILARDDGSVHVWDLVAQREIKSAKCPVNVAGPWQLSPDGKFLAAGEGPESNRLYLWEWQNDKPPRTIVGPEGRIKYVEFSPDQSILGTHIEGDVGIRLWDVATGKLRRRLVTEQNSAHLRGFCFSRDGKTVAGTDHQTRLVVLWDVATGAVKRTLPHLRYGGGVAFSVDGRWIAASGPSGIRLLDTVTGKLAEGDAGHADSIELMAFSPSGNVIATAGGDTTVRLWDPRTGKQLHVLHHTEEWIRGIAFTPDGKLVATSGFDDTVRLWEVDTGRQIHRLVGNGGWNGNQRHVGFTPDGRRLVAWGNDCYLRVFDVATGKAIREHRPAPKGVELPDDDDEDLARRDRRRDASYFLQATFLPNAGQLLMSWKKGIHFFDVATGKVQRMLTWEGAEITEMHCAPDQRRIIFMFGQDVAPGSVANLTTGKILFHFAGSMPSWSHDSRIVAAIEPNAIALWETAIGTVRLVMPTGKIVVASFAFSPDGRYLTTGLADSTALVWDLAKLATASPKGQQPR